MLQVTYGKSEYVLEVVAESYEQVNCTWAICTASLNPLKQVIDSKHIVLDHMYQVSLGF